MTFVIIGAIVAHTPKGEIVVQDRASKEQFTVVPLDDEMLEMEDGTEGILIGTFTKGVYKAQIYEPRKLLEPLYDVDLMEIAGQFVHDLKGDPFPDIFEKMQKKVVD